MRLKMNIMIRNISYWRKKLPKNVQKYGGMRTIYMQAILEKFPDVKKQQNDAEIEFWDDLAEDCWCKIHKPIPI